MSASSSSAAANTRKSVKGSGHLGMMTGRRNRQETMLTIRKAKKEDAYATRRNLKSNHPRGAGGDAAKDAASRKELLQNLAQRSQALLLGTWFSWFTSKWHDSPLLSKTDWRAVLCV